MYNAFFQECRNSTLEDLFVIEQFVSTLFGNQMPVYIHVAFFFVMQELVGATYVLNYFVDTFV